MNFPDLRGLSCVCIRLLLALSLVIGAAAKADPPPSHSIPSLRSGELLALDGGELLLWTVEGEAQLLTLQSEWLPVFRMPMSHVLQIVPQDGGFLALGVPEPGQAADAFPVVAYNNMGQQSNRWFVPPAWSLASGRGGASAITAEETMLPLRHDDSVGRPVPVPQWREQPPRDPRFASSPMRWRRFEWGDASVYCHDADVAKQGHLPARCHREGAAGWAHTFDDRQGGRVVAACGAWLVTQASGPSAPLTVIDMVSGQVAGQRNNAHAVNGPLLFSCAGHDELLLGRGRRLVLLALPGLTVRWRSPRLVGDVRALAVTRRAFVYRLGSQAEVRTMPRPAE